MFECDDEKDVIYYSKPNLGDFAMEKYVRIE